jgi:hypothetical protein
MAIAGLGNGGVPTTNIEALAGELRFLKSGMADLQGRLDALLSRLDGEPQGAQVESDAVAEVAVADLFAIEPAIAVAEVAVEAAEVSEIETPAVAEAIVATVEPAQPEVIAPVEIADTATMPETAIIELAALEPVAAEVASVAVPAEAVVETTSVADAAPTEPVAAVEVWAEPVVPVAEQVDAPAAELPGQSIVVLAEHREKVGARRGVIARTARWAAAIAMIATIAAVAATGTGFAANGDLLIKGVCAIAGEGCSTVLGML